MGTAGWRCSLSDRGRQVARVLEGIDRDEYSVAQGVNILKNPAPPARRGRAWIPLWLRIAFVPHWRGVRLTLPLFILGPLAFVGFILLLPFAAFVAGLISIRKRGVLGCFIQGIGLLCSLAVTLLLHGRGAGFRVRDRDTDIGFWLS